MILGVVLYLLARLWAKPWLKRNPGHGGAYSMTRAGIAIAVIFLSLMGIGLTSQLYAPGSAFAKFINSGIGFIVWTAMSTLVAVALEYAMVRRGFRVIVKNESGDV